MGDARALGAGALHPGDSEAAAFEGTDLLAHGVDISQGLAWMVNLGLEVDDGDLGILREGAEVEILPVLLPALSALGEADPHSIEILRKGPGGVADVLYLVVCQGAAAFVFVGEGIEVVRS